MKFYIRELKAEIQGPCAFYDCVHDFHLHRVKTNAANAGWQPVGADDCYSDAEIVAVAVVER